MDGNKDESQKCIDIALKNLRLGQKDKALKFLHKAQRLYPSDKARGNQVSIIKALITNFVEKQQTT